MFWLFVYDELPDCRWCAYCHQPYPATHEFFQWHRGGRYDLQTICRYCQNHNARVLRRLRRMHGPPPESCQQCGAYGPLQLDHCHETDAFRAWACHPCNMRARHPFRRGPRQRV